MFGLMALFLDPHCVTHYARYKSLRYVLPCVAGRYACRFIILTIVTDTVVAGTVIVYVAVVTVVFMMLVGGRVWVHA
jgi:hypothetical protein